MRGTQAKSTPCRHQSLLKRVLPLSVLCQVRPYARRKSRNIGPEIEFFARARITCSIEPIRRKRKRTNRMNRREFLEGAAGATAAMVGGASASASPKPTFDIRGVYFHDGFDFEPHSHA